MENYVGKRLDGRYEIRDVVGVGGMAVVYKAYDNIDDRIVAVKILKDEYLTNEEFRRRFKNESKAIAVLSHRNIVKVFDVSFGDRLQYIVMEYIEGITLKEYIEERGVIDWNEALFFSIQILRALQHAHDKGIVHRDVKPQNIMLLEDGTIKVTDFGIARFSHGETRTMTEKAIGSVHYISPEQAKGEMTDEKADIYSVGVVLYEMLTGKLPFEAESAVSVALMQVNNEAALPRSINPRIPVGFEQITMKAMQKSTRDRYQSASEVLFDLEELKRNPNIKFDYQIYYNDDQATRYVGKIQGSTRGATTPPPTRRQPERAKIVPPVSDARRRLDDVRESDNMELAPSKSGIDKKTIGIIAGVAVALIIFVVVIVINMLKNDSLILGVNKKIEVANFIGMNYEEEIKGNPEFLDIYNFEIKYETNSTADPGCVARQDPDPGTERPFGSTILLYVSRSGEPVIVPDVTGQDYRTASAELESYGFVVSIVSQESDSGAVNSVIKTSPGAGESVDEGSSITIYYVKKETEAKPFKMPSLNGKTLEEAKDIIAEKGLVLGNVDEVDSPEDEDIVIEQSPLKGVPVKEGDAVNLTISTGRSVVEKTIKLPSDVGTLNLRVLVDGSEVESESVDTSSQSSYSFTVGGDKANTPIKVYIGNDVYYEAIADFTKSPAKLSKEKYHNLSFYVDVVGMSRDAAINKLNSAGYNNVTIKTEISSEPEGTVIAQTPKQSSAPNLDSSTTIVLTVAAAEKTTAPTTQPTSSTETSSTDVSETEE